MNHYLLTIARRIFLIGMFLLCTTAMWAQVYQNGIRKGMVKVKFSTTMTTSLSQMKVSARSSGLTTGIETFDAVAKSTTAKNMYRMFPYDAKNEGKLRKHGLHLWYVVEIDPTVDPKQAAAIYKNVSGVSVAEVEHEKILAPHTVNKYVPSATTFETLPFNDPMLKDQWHYNNTGQTGFGDADINLFEAWTKTAGANNIIVAVHDQGVDVKHTDLKANIWVNQAEFNGTPNVDDDGNGYVDDINGYNFEKNKGALDAQFHGTHVAGTIAAVNNNGKGVSGVAGGTGNGDGVKIMSLQIFGNAAVEKTYVYAANNGAVISQNSWGYSSPYYYDQSILDAIDYFVAEAGDYEGSPMKGGIVIFAAGNSDYDAEWYPGYHPSALAVAALGPEWKKASYSNYGSWVELSAPGGDQGYGTKNGVLSTIPDDQYAYLQGTSMACPHVSGIAALALANRTKQLTNTELWNKLVTGVVGIDQYNENYIGKLGTGAIDASLAIKNDLEKAPQKITDLTVTGVAQEFATLSWNVPVDEDDEKPLTFELYYYTQSITANNLGLATKVEIKNTQAAASTITHEVSGLLGLTKYYFVVTATDRWGNVSVLSNEASGTTNDGPTIAVDANSQTINLSINAATSTTGTKDITILNNGPGILRWNHFMRHKTTSLSFTATDITYPTVTKQISSSDIRVGMVGSEGDGVPKIASSEPVPFVYTPIEKIYTQYTYYLIGETDTELTNSTATRFYVNEANGFNLTQVKMYMKFAPANGPVVVEVYKGLTAEKSNLVYAQNYTGGNGAEHNAFITLTEQLFFETGSTFWVVLHFPAGNLYPIGIGPETDPSYSSNCLMSFNMGSTWAPLEDLINKDFAFSIVAGSYNADLGTYLTLEPGSGDVEGNNQAMTTLTANASTLINGTYKANLVLASNDAKNRELRIPVNVTVSGHVSKLKHPDIVDFGSVFQGGEKIIDVVIKNEGFGNFNTSSAKVSLDNAQFTFVGSKPTQVKAREEAIYRIKFSPTGTGNVNAILTLQNSASTQTYQVALFGVGTETSKITITPENQTVNNVTIGDVVNTQITVQNTGAYPLKYFIPGYDTKGISDNWPTSFQKYGYKFRSNYSTDTNPITYEFQNIATTGVKVTDLLRDDGVYAEVDMGFDFPYYGTTQNKIYIAQKGFTTFDNSVRPVNTPNLNNSYAPIGFISPLGTYVDLTSHGDILYQLEADRIIIQYNNITDGYSGDITAQMVLYANGNIRFAYDYMGWSLSNQKYLTVLIEDMDKEDGILLHNYSKNIQLSSGTIIGFDYPGPNIITNVVNGSGLLMPGTSSVVDLTLSTSSLVEGTVNRYVNFISNDPTNGQKSALVQLDITGGGTAMPFVSEDTIMFGNVFQGAIRSQGFIVKNNGTADVNISSMTFVNGSFILTGEQPTSVRPGLYKKYDIQIPTASIATLEDWLSINYSDGTYDTIRVTGNVVDAPAINVDLSLLQQTLAYGETIDHPLNIENTGLADLEVTPVGKQWLTFSAPSAPTSSSFVYEKHNTGGVYQWIDIRKTGTQMPFANDVFNKEEYWRNLTLPFPINVFGQTYTDIKIGENGLISLDGDPEPMIFTEPIPTQENQGAFIMPYWTFGGFDTYFYAAEDVGIFYQFYDDKVIITWSHLVNFFGGMGDPMSAQVIIYKNGSMKFQYKIEGSGSNDFTSQFSAVAVQKNSTTAVILSSFNVFDHGKGLAYVVVPANKYVVAPGTTLAGQLTLDAKNTYGGVYNENLMIHTNVPNLELREKPVELTVTGQGALSVPAKAEFGTNMFTNNNTYFNIDTDIENTGTAPVKITGIKMATAASATSYGTQYLDLTVWASYYDWFGNPAEGFVEVQWLNDYFPDGITILPGEKLKAQAYFNPKGIGAKKDSVIFTTSVGEIKTLVMTANGIKPPVFGVDTTPIYDTLNTLIETSTASIAINNTTGQSDLNYEVSIDFGRETESRPSEVMATSSSVQSALVSKEATDVKPVAKIAATYNRTLQHTPKQTPDTYVGVGGSGSFAVATKYNAGPQGFNLSHVETWFRTEALMETVVNVEIRAGGTSIQNAPTLAEGQLTYQGSGNDEVGAWHAITMDEPAGIYPNEDFYVIVTYPMGIEFPQGTVNDEPTVSNRYFYLDYNDGLWYDIQLVNGFATMGWLMLAAEETPGNSAWLSITSPVDGSIAAGQSSNIELLMEGPFAQRGNQVANIIIKSNDPKKESVSVPVTLHVNEAPSFTNVPEAILMSEKETLTINIDVADAENNLFTLASAEAYSGVTHSFSNGKLTITLSPDYGDEGNYTYVFKATDEHNAVSEVTLLVEVLHTNRAPEFIGSTEAMSFNATGLINEYALEDFFSDPDGDEFTFTLASSNSTSVMVYASESSFIIRPLETGEAKLAFVVTDIHGAATKDTLTVIVDVVLGAEEGMPNNGLGVYPNPAKETAYVTFSNDWTGDVVITVLDVTGKLYITKQSDTGKTREVKVNVSGLRKGIYILHAIANDRRATIKLIKE